MYYIIEIQQSENGEQAYLVHKPTVTAGMSDQEIRDAAESVLYQILAAAAISKLPLHTAVMIDDHGMQYFARAYERPRQEPEQPAEETAPDPEEPALAEAADVLGAEE